MRVVTLHAADRFGASPGTVHLVGAGPGDPGLLTLRAASLLATADLVLHDQLVSSEILALVDPRAEVQAVGRRCEQVVVTHEDVLDRLIAAGRSGRRVVRLKGGDPVVFGRGGEEAMACVAAGVAVELVPGVTSAIAGPELAGIPVTHRDRARGFLVVTAHTTGGSDVDWAPIAAFPGTVVVLMGHARWAEVTADLIAAGRRPDEPAAAIACASTPGQQVVSGSVASIAEAGRDLPTPAVLVIGDVVSLRDRIRPTDADRSPVVSSLG